MSGLPNQTKFAYNGRMMILNVRENTSQWRLKDLNPV